VTWPRAGGQPQRTKFTGRAAVLAIVVCAVALSLAYPVREYIAERRQISALEQQDAQLAGQISRLQAEHRSDTSPSYIEQQARDQLHMCFPTQTCYVVVNPRRTSPDGAAAQPGTPWYALLWKSVQEADKPAGKMR
jgi:cell division protein FtsL